MNFAAPAVLFALIALPAIWWLLRLMPPRPKSEAFPPARILAELTPKEETPAQTPWWLTALRLALAALLIFALAGPALRSGQDEAPGAGPLLLIVDNGWASAGNWTAIRDGALAIAEFAERAERPVALFATAEPSGGVVAPADPGEIADRILSLEPQPFAPDYAAALPQLRTIADTASFGGAAWISDGLHHEGADDLVDFLAEMVAGPVTVYRDSDRLVLGLAPPANGVDGLDVPVLRQDGEAAAEGVVIARDLRGRAIGEAGFAFAAGETRTEATFDVPPDLRNEIVRLEITGEATAGAVQLLDDRYRRRTVGLLSSEPSEQPLLSAEYYLSRALLPFADLATSSGDVGQSLIDMIQSGISVIVLADFGTLPADAEAALTDWVEAGGTLVQFAGPRLAASEPTLIPVPLRQGGRVLGGALSWEEPQPLGPFPRTSPFFGLDVPDDVLVQRQVLAEPSAALTDRVWANLADGTPLVTGGALGDGLLVLFHVTADTEWSNLPLSGVFVEMLRRITSLAAAPEGDAAGDAIATALPPYRVLDGYGRFTDPGPAAEPLSGTLTDLLVGAAHPPGFYGAEDLFRAVSLLGADAELAPFDVATIEGADAAALPGATAIELRPWLLAAVLALLLADTLAVLWLSGALAGRRPQIAALVLAALLLPALPSDGNAQNELTPADLFALQAANNTALAYVVTGDPANDEISRAGLTGLSWVLRQRTSFEPPDPIGVDIATDELAFFPILYWRVAPAAPMPAPDAIARLETYLRNGGIILFDTADELQRTTADIAQATTAAGTYLRDMLATVDIPPLEPVPVDHVLTKTYYLIQDFPGRYTGGAFWVEILADAPELAENRPARPTDGISPIMVTSNDLAGAWAIDDNGAFLFPMANNDPRLREMSFRAGVNIVMYALTGNYKTDQVHVPDLLERLGQ